MTKPLGSWPPYDYEQLQKVLKPAYEETVGRTYDFIGFLRFLVDVYCKANSIALYVYVFPNKFLK